MASATETSDEPARAQVITAVAIGAALTLIGILGFLFVPVEGLLFGLFGVNALHNAVHVLTGVTGLVAGYYAAGSFSTPYNRYGGLAYLLLGVAWFVVTALLVDLLNINLADTGLHLALGVILAGVGFGAARHAR